MASEEGEFDNFTFINNHNLSQMEALKQTHVRPQTELLIKSSFSKMRGTEGEQSSNISSNEEQAEGRERNDSQQAGAAETTQNSR